MADEHASQLVDELRRLLPDQLQDYAVVLLDAEGRILAWLSNSERIFGYSASEAIGRPVATLFTPEDVRMGMPDYERLSATQKGGADNDRWMLRKDGLRFWATGTMNPLKSQAGEILGYVKVLRNRTDLKGQIAGLGQRITSLERADERKNAFIVTLGHELRNPLSALVNALELLRLSTPQSDDSRFAFTTIDRQIAAIRRLVDDLLDIAGIRAGKIELKKQHISLVDVLNAAVAACRPLFDERTHELNLILPEGAVVIDADPDRLQQVFVNLLQNAAKYTEYGGAVFVKLYVEGKHAVAKVEDTGIGISPELLPQIFDLFAQAEFSSRSGGLGIGLSVVKDLVSLHGGSVQVRSDGIGKGSTFTVRLPLADQGEGRADSPSFAS